MSSINFMYWLQGFFELNNPKKISTQQKEMILKHIAIVVDKTPFISWLEGFIEGNKLTSKDSIKIVKTKLESYFENITKAHNLSVLETILTQPKTQNPLFPSDGKFPFPFDSSKIYC